MSRVFDALRQSEQERTKHTETQPGGAATPEDVIRGVEDHSIGTGGMELLRPSPQESARVVSFSPEMSLAAEKYRMLAIRLKLMKENKPLQALVVTSAVAEDGKSCTAVNLAVTLARATGQKVLLLEGDLRRPVQSRNLGVDEKRGLSEFLTSEEKASDFIYKLDTVPVWLMPAGRCEDNAADLLQGPRAHELMNRLRGWFDWIIIDAPPLLPLADANVWSQMADGILLVVREGRTPKSMLKEGLESLHQPNILGLVLNDSTTSDAPYYYSHYAYGATREGKTSK
jgi:capsular exopolysaccharide synthesis family protein